MSKKSIPQNVKFQLWRSSGGRCEYRGCNKPLWKSGLTQKEFNVSYVAHIYGENPTSARYDEVLSPQLVTSYNNLMLLCDECHRLVDKGDKLGHPPSLLMEMKREHESRIELVTGINASQKSFVLTYGAKVGNLSLPLHWDRITPAMLPQKYPAEKPEIALGLRNSSFYDSEPDYWNLEREHLCRQFRNRVAPRLTEEIQHLSVFAFAPQPLLVELGRLISDARATDVYQLHREPATWGWQQSDPDFSYIIKKPENDSSKNVALKIALSASIDSSRIHQVLGKDVAIWELTIKRPNNDFVRGPGEVALFRQEIRKLFDVMKYQHGQNAQLHVFPAMPVSLAVELGRVWMPKADMSMHIYDQNKHHNGFFCALVIE